MNVSSYSLTVSCKSKMMIGATISKRLHTSEKALPQVSYDSSITYKING